MNLMNSQPVRQRMKWALVILFFAMLFPLISVSGAEVEGEFKAIGKVPEKGSQKTLVFEEFLNFTCPHCNNFRTASKPLLVKYAKRIRYEAIPILFRGQSDYPLRLYYIAQRAGREHEIKELLFDATFKYGVNVYDPTIVTHLSRSAGLGEEYKRDADSEWVSKKLLEGERRAALAGVEATPTVILAGAISMTPTTGMQTFVNNLENVISQLLQ